MSLLAISALVSTVSLAACTHRADNPPKAAPASVSVSAPSQPWSTAPLPGELANTLVGTANDLYTIYTTAGSGNGVTILKRIDPATGNIAATATISGLTDAYAPGQGRPVIADGALWVPSGVGPTGSVVLRGLDLGSLRTRAQLDVTFSGLVSGNDVAALAVGPDGTLYLGAGDSYVSIAPATGRLGARTTIRGGQIGGLAVAPDNSRVYVGVSDSLFFSTYTSETSFVQARQPLTGALTVQASGNSITSGTKLGGIDAMIASSGGVWVSNQAGPHGEDVRFIPIDPKDSQSALPDGSTGGGGALALATSTTATVWLGGGNHGVSCLDPSTGALRASNPTLRLTSIAVAGGQDFALTEDSRSVVRLTPPAQCAS